MSAVPGKGLVSCGARASAPLVLALILVSAAGCDSNEPATPAPTPVPTPAPAPTPPPAPPAPAVLESITLSESTVRSQTRPIGTVRLSAPAPAENARISLESSDTIVVKVPANVSVAAGETSNAFAIDTSTVRLTTGVTIVARYQGVTVSTVLTVLPPSLAAFFTVTSPSKGADACSIINGAGATDCQFDASKSEGIVSTYSWTFTVAGKELSTSVPEGSPVYTPPTDCTFLSGGSVSSAGTVAMVAALRVRDREGSVSNSTQKTVELTPNGFCGY